jgi:hypothetical protein
MAQNEVSLSSSENNAERERSAANQRRPRQHAVVFSGNGYNAAYEVGVLKALLQGVSPSTHKEKIEPGMASS